jgi:hypothetical protein
MWLREAVTEVLVDPIIRTRTRYFRHAYHPTRNNINMNINRNFRRFFSVVKLMSLFRRFTLYFVDPSKRNNVLVMLFRLCKANVIGM